MIFFNNSLLIKNMSKFPLYDSLYKEAEDKDISSPHRKFFLSKIEKLDQDGYELIYVLIKIYYLKHNDDSGIVLPYNGKYVNKNLPCQVFSVLLAYYFSKCDPNLC